MISHSMFYKNSPYKDLEGLLQIGLYKTFTVYILISAMNKKHFLGLYDMLARAVIRLIPKT